MGATSIKVFICDDDRHVREALESYCRRLCEEQRCVCDVRVFTDGADLVDRFEPDVDVLLLDVEMPLLDGMGAAHEIRGLGSDACIVFVSSFEQYAVPGYEVGAYRYLLKPVGYERFRASLADVFRSIWASKPARLAVKVRGGTTLIPLARVTHIETCGNHQVAVHLADSPDKPVVAYETIAKLAQGLPETFFRCHESCIVNFDYIYSVAGDEVEMVGGASVPVSKRQRAAFKEAFGAFARQKVFGAQVHPTPTGGA